MLARSATIFKWTLYALAGLVWAAVQGAVLRRFSVFGVLPFLYPLLAAIPATLEGPAPGAVYALVWGVVCDLLLPSSLPCFYTLIFPLVGLAAGLLFHCIVLWAQGHAAWSSGMSVTLRELCASLLWSLPMTWLFLRVFRRVHADD